MCQYHVCLYACNNNIFAEETEDLLTNGLDSGEDELGRSKAPNGYSSPLFGLLRKLPGNSSILRRNRLIGTKGKLGEVALKWWNHYFGLPYYRGPLSGWAD